MITKRYLSKRPGSNKRLRRHVLPVELTGNFSYRPYLRFGLYKPRIGELALPRSIRFRLRSYRIFSYLRVRILTYSSLTASF